MIISTEAIVLQSRKYSETSKIVVVYTKEIGKVTLMAKGARKAKNPFGSSLDPLSISFITFYKHPQKDMHLLSKSETFTPLKNVQDNYERITSGLLMMESIVQTQENNVPNPELFETLRKCLLKLNRTEDEPFSVFTYFQIILIKILGFHIDFRKFELISKKYVYQFVWFSLEDGSFSEEQNTEIRNRFRIHRNTYHYLSQISDSKFEDNFFPFDDNELRNEVVDFFIRYFSFHLEKKFFFRSYNLIRV